MSRKILSTIIVLAMIFTFMVPVSPVLANGPTTITLPGGSLTTATGAYRSAIHAYPHKWDITKGDLTIEGIVNYGGIQARGNTWDPNLTDGDDWFGVWSQLGLVKNPVFNSADGVWMVSVEWTGGVDNLNTQIREILHMQEEPGTQPMPKWYTGPRTITGGDGDDTYHFKLQIHSTGLTTGWAKLWIDIDRNGTLDLIKGNMESVFTPEQLDYTGEDLSCAQVLVGVMNGNNPNNPAHTFSWSDLTVTGYPACYDEVWVDDNWAGTTPGTEVEPGKYFGFNAFAKIQDGIDAVCGSVVNVAPGTYEENPTTTNKSLNFVGIPGTGGELPVIKGTLTIDSSGYTPADNITIDSLSFSAAGDYDSIVLKKVDGVTIKNCTFDGHNQFLTFSLGGRAVQMSSPPNNNVTIDNCYFKDGYYVTIQGYVNGLTVKNSTITNCKSGINLQNGGNLVVENTDIDVIAQGVTNDTYCVRFASSLPTTASNMTITAGTFRVNKNNFTAEPETYYSAIIVRSGATGTLKANWMNIYGEVVNLSSVQLDATYNWWGDESGPSGVGPGTGNAVSANVDYSPWLVPNISVTKSDSPDPVAQGMPLTYTLNWIMGSTWATWDGTTIDDTPVNIPSGLTFGNVSLKDTLPPEVTYVSCTGGGTHSLGIITWNLGKYTPGKTGSITVNVNVNLDTPDGTIINNVEISYDTLKLTNTEDTTIQQGAGCTYIFYDTRNDAYIMFCPCVPRWRVTIPSKGYDTGWMPFRRYTRTNNHFWGEYADTRYHLIIDFYSSGRYHIIFDDRVTRISIKIAN